MSRHKATKAGSWYPAEADELFAMVRTMLDEAQPAPAGATPVAAIAPHAGLAYSGSTAAAAYRALMGRPVETVVVLGAVHTMMLPQPAVWTSGAWETPLGDIAIDETLAKAIVSTCGAIADERPHLRDNAIELQTPFIKVAFPQARMVPIAMPPVADAAQFGARLAALVDETTTVSIASTDLTHYGASFGLMPAGSGQPAVDWTHANDRRLIDMILALDAEAIVPCAERDHSACGAGAVAALAAMARTRKWNARLLDYCTSHDRMPEEPASHLVGYAAILFAH